MSKPSSSKSTSSSSRSFGGKQAAPFAKGGGRDTSHPHTAHGTPRQTGGAKSDKK